MIRPSLAVLITGLLTGVRAQAIITPTATPDFCAKQFNQWYEMFEELSDGV